jgi:hypothetical protein
MREEEAEGKNVETEKEKIILSFYVSKYLLDFNSESLCRRFHRFFFTDDGSDSARPSNIFALKLPSNSELLECKD